MEDKAAILLHWRRYFHDS